MCSKKCTIIPSEQVRLNSWRIKDSPKDKCFAKCIFRAYDLVKSDGAIDMDTLTKTLSGSKENIDMSNITVRNVNEPEFLGNVIAFINKNRAVLAKVLNHPEAA